MKRRGKALTRIIISYTVMVCIPILIAMAVYGITYGIVKQQANAYNKSLITMIQSSCDSEIRYYKSVLENLRAENELQQMSRCPEYSSAKDYWDDYLGQKLLHDNGKYLSEHCHDLFIWMGNKQKVVNTASSMSYDRYEKIVCQGDTERGPFDAVDGQVECGALAQVGGLWGNGGGDGVAADVADCSQVLAGGPLWADG